MPIITVEGPRLEKVDAKRVLVKKLTDIATQTFKLPADSIIVLIKENPPENVGVGGKLVIDKAK